MPKVPAHILVEIRKAVRAKSTFKPKSQLYLEVGFFGDNNVSSCNLRQLGEDYSLEETVNDADALWTPDSNDMTVWDCYVYVKKVGREEGELENLYIALKGARILDVVHSYEEAMRAAG
jgi:hypothetical protein